MPTLTRGSSLGRSFGGCCGTLAALSRAAAKAAGAKLRRARLLPDSSDWPRRAEICERCPLRVIHRNITYCGTPLLHQPVRDPTLHGCGCPCLDKAKRPDEHCPLNGRHQASTTTATGCDCKWCMLASSVGFTTNGAGTDRRDRD